MTRSPLTPPDCDLRDFPRMMLDIQRLRGSGFDATLDDAGWRAGVNLWMTAWHQVPAASLPDDEAELTKAAGLGRDVRTWRKVKTTALRGWVKCSDDRLYHETSAEIALEAWIDKLGQRLSSGAGNAKRYGHDFDPAPLHADIKLAAGMLEELNPKSRSLSKPHVQKALRGVPLDLPPGAESLPPGAPPGSQGNGMEGNGTEIQDAHASYDRERVLEELWDAYPHVKGRSSRPKSRKALEAVPLDCLLGLPDAARAFGRKCDMPNGPPALERWIADERWRDWLEAPAAERQTWAGPADIRAAFVRAKGEDWTASWIDRCAWQDVPERTLIPATRIAAERIVKEAKSVLDDLELTIPRKAA